MKKYLIVLLPFIVCSILALIYGNLEPKNFPDPIYPYRTPGMLQYLSTRWFIIGAVVSILLFILFLIEDDLSGSKRNYRKGKRNKNEPNLMKVKKKATTIWKNE